MATVPAPKELNPVPPGAIQGWGPGMALAPAQSVNSVPPTSTSRLSSWPRSAQWAAAVLVGMVLVLLAYHALANTSFGTRASQLLVDDGPLYRLDLNRARRAELMQVPGIGPRLAERIVAHREANGQFLAVADLRTVSGIGEKTLARIKPWLCVDVDGFEAVPKKNARANPVAAASARSSSSTKEIRLAGQVIDINQASAEELQKLPRIGPKMAQRILEERAKAPFRTVDELRRVKGIGPKTLDKLRPYASVGKSLNE